MNERQVADYVVGQGTVQEAGRVIVKVAKDGWVCLTHQDHGSYFVPHWEARSLALRLLRAADQAELNDGQADG